MSIHSQKAYVGWVIFFMLVASCLTQPTWAAPECNPWVAKIVSVEGTTEARRANQVNWKPATVGETFCAGDRIRVLHWRTAIVLSNNTIIRLDQGTTLTFTKIGQEQSSWLDVVKGIVHFISRVPRRLTVTTPFVNADVEGTEFMVRVDDKQSTVWVFEGRVHVKNAQGTLLLTKEQAATAQAGLAPRYILVQPKDAVHWAMHYPTLIDTHAVSFTGPYRQILEGALAMYHSGDLNGALQQMDVVPLSERDTQFLTMRAGWLLSVGRIKRASEDIAQALHLEPGHGMSLALQSIMAVVHNDKEMALKLAKEAVRGNPDAAVPHIALSYAYQAAFKIEQALTSAQDAMRLNPANGLAWARVAELWLSQGNVDRALEVAEQAVGRNPKLARTQTVLGFAELSQFNRAQARAAFEVALALDQADPLPRLGLGLLKIKNGHVGEGRQELEIAASLDPTNALIRSYLGKAYFEERRNDLAASQLDMAKMLDPKDPTAYFYDAIRKQTVNRPVEALWDLQKSIELNDNRAVYRSRLLLDDDQAARSASLGRIYTNLGFGQRALVEGWKSLTTDPRSHSAHRLLADSYASRPRHGIARVSELLQTQLLQPININNLQPSLAENRIGLLESAGPSVPSFNEFNPLFMRDRLGFLGNAVFGNNDTVGDDVVVSGMLADRLSLSLGQFHYETDGFRANNDVKHDVYNIFLQGQPHPKVNIQAEFRRRQSEQGDLEQRFSPNFLKATERREIEQNVYRVGARVAPTSDSDVIFSYLHSKRTDTTFEPGVFRGEGEDEGYQVEGQYLFRHTEFKAVVGGGRSDIDADNLINGTFIPDMPDKFRREYTNAYVYVNREWPKNITWTGGLSYNDLSDKGLDLRKVSPKMGIQWDFAEGARFRLAYLQAVKRALIVNQTIEPTQIAGFNQFYDDPNGTETERYGVAVDATFSANLFGGVEYSQRNLKAPEGSGSKERRRFDRMEKVFRGYLYWTPHPMWALGAEPAWEQFKRQADALSVTGSGAVLPKVETFLLPVAAKFFHPSGFFATIGGTFVRQKVDLAPASPFTKDRESFFLVDTSVGFRLPKRTGIISLEVRNLFDESFFYEDLNFVTAGESVIGRFVPNRTIFGRLTLYFG
ncbi:MAG: tetratricopeptide repeat protein [Nitrospirales bacterium]|nr:tetratricopeptide repeat protein [Nitrospirales bacterium]